MYTCLIELAYQHWLRKWHVTCPASHYVLHRHVDYLIIKKTKKTIANGKYLNIYILSPHDPLSYDQTKDQGNTLSVSQWLIHISIIFSDIKISWCSDESINSLSFSLLPDTWPRLFGEFSPRGHEYIENKVWDRVANYLWAQKRFILLFISPHKHQNNPRVST